MPTCMIIIIESPSQILIFLVRTARLILEKDTSNYLELSLPRRSICGTDFYLPLEGTVLPVVQFILIISGHLQPLFSILVHQFE
jgi:hypothetical protein